MRMTRREIKLWIGELAYWLAQLGIAYGEGDIEEARGRIRMLKFRLSEIERNLGKEAKDDAARA